MPDQFDKFTERARKVLQFAQEEAQRFSHNYVGTEHLLLGLIREGDGVAARVLVDLEVRLNWARSAVEFVIGRGDRTVTGDIGLTPRTKKVLELAVDEARRLDHHYVGTEHLLLGLLREGEGIGAGVLESLGVSLHTARRQVMSVLNQQEGAASYLPEAGTQVPMGRAPTMRDLVRVLPIAQTQTQGSMTLTLLSAELYADGFIVHGRILRSDDEPLFVEGFTSIPTFDPVASDDRGGSYDPIGRRSGDGYADAWRFTQGFGPGLDAAARELRLQVPEVSWERRGIGGADLEIVKIEVQAGPWEFTVALAGDVPETMA